MRPAAREAVCTRAPGTRWHGFSFGSHGIHKKAAEEICHEALLAGTDTCRAMSIDDLPSQFRGMLGVHGVGYWSWKPHFIARRLRELPEGDLLLYFDRELPITRHQRLDPLFCIGQNVVGGVGLTHQTCLPTSPG